MKTLYQIVLILVLGGILNYFVDIDKSNDFSFLIPFKMSELSFNETLIYEDMLVHNVITETENLEFENKKIYLYNTHQTEGYQTNTVMDGARYLKALLEEKGYTVIFEETSFDQYKIDNGMDLTETYPASRVFLIENINTYGSFDLIIDFHRDALPRESAYTTIDGINYAKMMMVIGGASKNSENVAYNSRMLHEAVDEILSGVMRSDFVRDSAVYNQDYTDKMVLVEVGGNTSTFDEVKKSVEVLASAIDLCLQEDRFV